MNTCNIVLPIFVNHSDWQNMGKNAFVYILSNASMTLYIGITSNLESRTIQHMNGEGGSFTSKYKLWKLVYFEVYADPKDAIQREKQLKRWRREKKITLIERVNPEFARLI
jgi:putative endonuclease